MPKNLTIMCLTPQYGYIRIDKANRKLADMISHERPAIEILRMMRAIDPTDRSARRKYYESVVAADDARAYAEGSLERYQLAKKAYIYGNGAAFEDSYNPRYKDHAMRVQSLWVQSEHTYVQCVMGILEDLEGEENIIDATSLAVESLKHQPRHMALFNRAMKIFKKLSAEDQLQTCNTLLDRPMGFSQGQREELTFMRGKANADLGHPEKAIVDLAPVVSKGSDIEAHMILASQYKQLGRNDAMIRVAVNAMRYVDTVSKEVALRELVGDVWIVTYKNHRESDPMFAFDALRLGDLLLSSEMNCRALMVDMAKTCLEKGQIEEADSMFSCIAREDLISRKEAELWLLEVMIRKNKFNEAKAMAEAMHGMYMLDPDIEYEIACIHAITKDWKEVCRYAGFAFIHADTEEVFLLDGEKIQDKASELLIRAVELGMEDAAKRGDIEDLEEYKRYAASHREDLLSKDIEWDTSLEWDARVEAYTKECEARMSARVVVPTEVSDIVPTGSAFRSLRSSTISPSLGL